jgi:hypothetical protein
MVKLSHHPTREEMKRLRERWDREDEDDIPLKPFDTTLTSGIDDTVRHLKSIRERSHADNEEARVQSDGIARLTTEVHEVNEELARIVETLNRKASKGQLNKGLGDFSLKFDKRVDNIFKLIAALGVVLGILITVKGHS